MHLRQKACGFQFGTGLHEFRVMVELLGAVTDLNGEIYKCRHDADKVTDAAQSFHHVRCSRRLSLNKNVNQAPVHHRQSVHVRKADVMNALHFLVLKWLVMRLSPA
jgi:hypothetical protein